MSGTSSFVIPAKAGTHLPTSPLTQGEEMDSRLRGNDMGFGETCI